MVSLEHFEVVRKRGFFRPVGRSSFDRAVEQVAEVMRVARGMGLQSLLIDTTGITGFTSPGIFGRHAMAVKWAESAGPCLHVAMVVRPEMMDPDKIATVMAQNRGVSGDVFVDETKALAWLDSRHPNTT